MPKLVWEKKLGEIEIFGIENMSNNDWRKQIVEYL